MTLLKRLSALLVALAAAGLAMSVERTTRGNDTALYDDKAGEACMAQLRSSPPFLALKDRMELKAEPSKATATEVALFLDYHLNYLVPCRKIELEAAGKVHPALVEILAESYARSEASSVKLVTGQISWGEWHGENDAIGAWASSQLTATGAWLRGGRDSAFTRQSALSGAARSLRNWAYHQQTLIQQQSAIDPKSRTRLVTCQYVGSILECTTS